MLVFMAKKSHPRSRHKAVYHVRNWSEYDQALVKRGWLTVWVSDEVLAMWQHAGPPQGGAQFTNSDQAIEAMLTVKEVFHLTNRASEGFLRSQFELLELALPVADHTTLSRRGKQLSVKLPKRAQGPLYLVMDSSGLKVFGEGEWKVGQHGYSKRRTWRKLHLLVDSASAEIQAAFLSAAGVHDADLVQPALTEVEQPVLSLAADGAYDKRKVYQALQACAPAAGVNIPPRKDARIWQHGNVKAPPLPRDENLGTIRKSGRRKWKQSSAYHRRSLAETAVFRIKTMFGNHLTTRLTATQKTQAMIRCKTLNQMTHLGMPQSHWVG